MCCGRGFVILRVLEQIQVLSALHPYTHSREVIEEYRLLFTSINGEPFYTKRFAETWLEFLQRRETEKLFVSISTYRAKQGEEDVIIALHEDWAPRYVLPVQVRLACELLRSLIDPRVFMTIVHSESQEALETVIDDFKRQGLFGRVESLVEGELMFSNYTSEWQLR